MKKMTFVLVFIFYSSICHANSIVYSVNGIKKATKLGEAETIVKSLTTGNHHCSHDCQGEPTRTPYRIDYTVDFNKYEITDAKLACTGGPCGFSQVHAVHHTKNSAFGAFDVWTRPTSWTLTITQKRKIPTTGETVQIDSDQINNGKSFVVEFDTNLYLDVELEAHMPFGTVKMHPSKSLKKYFELLGTSDFGSIKKIHDSIQGYLKHITDLRMSFLTVCS